MVGELIRLAKDGTDEKKESAASALWFLADDNPANRDAVRESGGVPVLVGLARDGTDGQKASAAGALRSLTIGNPANRDAMRESGGVPVKPFQLQTETMAKAAGLKRVADVTSEDGALRSPLSGMFPPDLPVAETLTVAMRPVRDQVPAGVEFSAAPQAWAIVFSGRCPTAMCL